jgi:hypothetical protein
MCIVKERLAMHLWSGSITRVLSLQDKDEDRYTRFASTFFRFHNQQSSRIVLGSHKEGRKQDIETCRKSVDLVDDTRHFLVPAQVFEELLLEMPHEPRIAHHISVGSGKAHSHGVIECLVPAEYSENVFAWDQTFNVARIAGDKVRKERLPYLNWMLSTRLEHRVDVGEGWLDDLAVVEGTQLGDNIVVTLDTIGSKAHLGNGVGNGVDHRVPVCVSVREFDTCLFTNESFKMTGVLMVTSGQRNRRSMDKFVTRAWGDDPALSV